MKKTKIDIISGFLGCGKTTFIKKIISELENLENLVIIENEFGEISIDGKILEAEGLKIKEINAGCICCSVSDDFDKTIKDINDKFKPDRIIIEPSGVGKLSEIVETCKKYPDKFEVNKRITIVDAKKYFMYLTNFKSFYKDQIENSDIVIFSRLTEALSKVTNINDIMESISSINASTIAIDKEWNEFSADEVFKIEENNNSISGIKSFDKLDLTNKFEKNIKMENNSPINKLDLFFKPVDKHFDSITIIPNGEVDQDRLKKAFEVFDSKACGDIIRAKGRVLYNNKNYFFDYVPGEADIYETTEGSEYGIVVIGENIDKNKIETLLKK